MEDPVPPRVQEYADQVVTYVRNALNVTLEYNSETLPVVDHYLKSAEGAAPATMKLMIVTAGAYFGEVVRRHIGGRWELIGDDTEWRMVLPTGLNFAPAGMVAAAIAKADLADLDSEIDAPARMKEHVQQALSRMGEVTTEEYYSLCGRLDTLEHLHEVLVAVAAQMMGDAVDDDDAAPEAASDEPSGPVN